MATWWIILAQFVCVQLASGDVMNLALNKPVNMSSQYLASTPATKAVDGIKGTNGYIDEFEVMHTVWNKTFAWWWVDLQSQVQDATVNIYFRTNYKVRRNGVQLYTSTTSFNTYPSEDLCHTVTGRPDGIDIPDVVSVNCSGTWRYLMVYTDTDNSGQRDGAVLDFGEVEVLACTIGTYGANCTKTCLSRHCSVTSLKCDRYTGTCPGGCQAGWMVTDCTQVCSSLTYGQNCAKSCSSRHCAVTPTSCNRFTGACPDGGCKTGYRMQDCAEVCGPNMYGPGCSLSCGDRHCRLLNICHHETGRCDNGCQSGWNGTDCIQECPAGTYGDSCSQLCSGRNCVTSSDTCDHVTGACLSGCQAGWNGTDCKLQCLTGTYGANCRKFCIARHCKTQSSPCDRETGVCPNGCQDGWNGDDCSNQCPKGTFGIGCVSCSIRHCKGDSDCPRDGTCSGGCQEGWTLENCTQACPNGEYGPGCGLTCGNCTGGAICNHVTGNCPGDCKAGWRGSQCIQTCPSGKYGVNCMETCGHCADTCDVEGGHCLGGCQEGYCGAQCHLRLMSDTGVDSVSPVIGAVLGAVVMFVVNGAVLFCLLRYGRLQWVKSSRSKDSTQPREMTDIARSHVISHGAAERPLSGSSHTYNNDYAVLDTDTKSDNKDYDVIKSKQYENL